jgi:hypothetical protein
MTVRAGDVEDARAIDAASCAALAGAFAVVVALAIDPTTDTVDDHGDEVPDNEASALTEPSSAPPVHRPKQEATTPRPSPPSPWASRFASGLGGSIVWGPLPEASPGIVGALFVRFDRLRVGAIGTLSLPQSPRFDRNAGATFDMLEVGAFGAYMVPLGVFAIGPAANVEATYLQVRGFGIRRPWATSAVWPTGVVGGRVEARVARWFGLFARGDILFSTDLPRISLATPTDGVRLHTPAAVAPRLSFGAEVIFP